MTEAAISPKSAPTYVVGVPTDKAPEVATKRATPRARKWADVYKALSEMQIGKWLPVQFEEGEAGEKSAKRLRHAVGSLAKKYSLNTLKFTTRWDAQESVLYINKTKREE